MILKSLYIILFNKIKYLSIIIIVIFFIFSCKEEIPIKPTLQGSIKGKIYDVVTELPLSEVIVEAKNNKTVDTTNGKGLYKLKFLKVGYDTIKVTINGYDKEKIYYEIQPGEQEYNIGLKGKENLYIYVGAFGKHKIYIIDTDRLELVDSLYYSQGKLSYLAATPNGTRLYFSHGNNLGFFDSKKKTFNELNINFQYGYPIFSSDEKLFVFTKDNILFIDTLTNSLFYKDKISLNNNVIAFHPSLPVFYYLDKNEIIYGYNYEEKTFIDTIIGIQPNFLIFNNNGNKLYTVTNKSKLKVIDIKRKSIKDILTVNRLSHLGVTPDGNYLLITDPGSNIPPQPSSGNITVLNVNDYRIDGYIDLKPFAQYDNGSSIDIIISPSGKYAYVNSLIFIYIIDLKLRKAIKSISLYNIDGPIVSFCISKKI